MTTTDKVDARGTLRPRRFPGLIASRDYDEGKQHRIDFELTNQVVWGKRLTILALINS